MKHKIGAQQFVSAVFSLMLSASAVGNLITGYGLNVDSVLKIHLCCAFFAVVSSALFQLRYGGRIMLILSALTLCILWKQEVIWLQLQTISYIISCHYHEVYGWSVIGTLAAGDVSLPLILWGGLTATCVNWYMCRSKHIAVAILPAVLPLVLCLVTNDRVPSVIYLYGMILGIALLLMTDWTRKNMPEQGITLILRCVLPIAAALALLFGLNPRQEYVSSADNLQNEVMSWFQEFQEEAENVIEGKPIAAPVSEKLNLRSVGPKNQISYAVMCISAPVDGTLYLRGRDYDQYTGTGWESSPERRETFTSGGGSAGSLTIVTYGARDVLYVPYYATEDITLLGGALENDDKLQRYSYFLSRTASADSAIPDSRYTKLPEDTLAWAEELVNEITGDGFARDDKVLRIQNYVRSSAVYDLSTSRMDSAYSDFAQWFLEKSETGYCVHFATAATVLLRAAGIPARYVEGYMVNASEGSDVVVTNRNAHAWAEYYDSGAWHILEATPADPEAEETWPIPTIPETTPGETQGETETSDTEPHDPELTSTKPLIDQDDSMENTEGEGRESIQLPAWMRTVFNCLLLTAILPLQGYIRLIRKRTLWNRGRPNERTLNRWRQTRSISKLLKQPYPEHLDALAQKAKFSQHRIQPEELRRFEEYRHVLTKLISGKPWYQRLIFKWIFAVE